MRISLSILPPLLAVCVSAASLQPLLARRVPDVSTLSVAQGLERRQVSITSPSSVPAQCTSTCNPVNNEISLGCPATACCTISFETQYYNCFECVGMALGTTDYATDQNSLNLLYTTCVDMGFIMPQLALPGEPASGSNSSSSTAVQATPTGSVAMPSPKASSSVAPSGSSTSASARWRGVRAEMVVSAAVLLGVAGLW